MPKSAERTVFVLDDDYGARESLRWLIESAGHRVETFSRPSEFFTAYDPSQPGCLVLDIRMPEMSGNEVLQILRSNGNLIPTIVITAFGDIPNTVQAMKCGAVDVLEKPYNDQVLLDRIQQCHEQDAQIRKEENRNSAVRDRFNSLTPRERQVLELIFQGKSNKEMARILEISPKTVEIHRANVKEKMRADSVAELVQMAITCGLKE